ncbi:hypothetical protein FXO37_29642 [Capsicum annuum]|nr:hypothetical protein FXO37_29642 [Capsicum annuum]
MVWAYEEEWHGGPSLKVRDVSFGWFQADRPTKKSPSLPVKSATILTTGEDSSQHPYRRTISHRQNHPTPSPATTSQRNPFCLPLLFLPLPFNQADEPHEPASSKTTTEGTNEPVAASSGTCSQRRPHTPSLQSEFKSFQEEFRLRETPKIIN